MIALAVITMAMIAMSDSIGRENNDSDSIGSDNNDNDSNER